MQNFKFYKILSTQYFIYLWVSKSTRKIAICNISLIKNITLRCVTLPASRHVFLKYKRGSFPVKTIFRTLKVALSKRKKGFLLFTHQGAVRIFRQMRKKHTRLSVIGIKYDRLSIHANFSCLLLRRNKLVRISSRFKETQEKLYQIYIYIYIYIYIHTHTYILYI